VRQRATLRRRPRLGSRRRAKRLKVPIPLDGNVPPLDYPRGGARLRGVQAPRCCTCGKPLLRVPRSLFYSAPGRGFQCEDCFYPGTDRRPGKSALVSSARTRWWAELLEGGEGIG